MMIDRRKFLGAGLGGTTLALGGAFPGIALAAGISKVGLQLYTVRDLFAKDPVVTLQQVARIGYREVEFGGGGYDGMDHALLRRTMDRAGLVAPSTHITLESLTDKFDTSVAMAKTLGANTLVVPGIAANLHNEAGWQTVTTNLNRVGERLKKVGLGLAYHNHAFEFTTKPGGVSLYDRLLRDTDPALVKIELDLYWAAHAGEDPAALIERLGSRIYSYHVKDRRADGSMAAVGTGTTDFAALFKLKGSRHVRHFYVENDRAPAPYLPDITTSFETLRKLKF